jgi:hypothetical protein
MSKFAYARGTKLVLNLQNVKETGKTVNRLRRIASYFNRKEVVLTEMADTISKKYMKRMLRDYKRQIPQRRKWPEDYPIEFVSRKQQAKVMILLKGKPYQRRNRIQTGWEYKITTLNRDKIVIKFGNKWPDSKYVVGTIGFSNKSRFINEYTKHIQPFHTITGWQPAYVTYQKYMKKAVNEANNIAKRWYLLGFKLP